MENQLSFTYSYKSGGIVIYYFYDCTLPEFQNLDILRVARILTTQRLIKKNGQGSETFCFHDENLIVRFNVFRVLGSIVNILLKKQ